MFRHVNECDKFEPLFFDRTVDALRKEDAEPRIPQQWSSLITREYQFMGMTDLVVVSDELTVRSGIKYLPGDGFGFLRRVPLAAFPPVSWTERDSMIVSALRFRANVGDGRLKAIIVCRDSRWSSSLLTKNTGGQATSGTRQVPPTTYYATNPSNGMTPGVRPPGRRLYWRRR